MKGTPPTPGILIVLPAIVPAAPQGIILPGGKRTDGGLVVPSKEELTKFGGRPSLPKVTARS